jgi:hypothetical protein
LAFGETSDLRYIEEQGAQGVGCVGVEGLQTAPEPGVAVTVRSATRIITKLGREASKGMEVFSASPESLSTEFHFKWSLSVLFSW